MERFNLRMAMGFIGTIALGLATMVTILVIYAIGWWALLIPLAPVVMYGVGTIMDLYLRLYERRRHRTEPRA
jgi:ABC-type transport system involved in Fe-S cluster assembly fused permease/ATPase subunit